MEVGRKSESVAEYFAEFVANFTYVTSARKMAVVGKDMNVISTLFFQTPHLTTGQLPIN